ncbi:MAG: carbohydrate binding family 9 domain-containing protein, partial [Armatimonadetes bacterium]|nr:carbohydrate binding family 9 domain-containing protein [Armatimonadota bacterium]
MTIEAVRVDEPPEIDGKLDDACWQKATRVEGFWRTVVDAAEMEPTEAWICYGEEAIYAAFRCHDSKPSEIRCDQKKRQGNIWGDDFVELGLDVENSGRNEYTFRVNAAGTQQDQVPGGTSEKIEWKGDWRAAAKRDESGWTAEMEIPFAMLRYPDGQEAFGVYIARYLSRQEDVSIWPKAMARKQDLTECAVLAGVTTPPVGLRYVLMPYALSVASENDDDREPLTGGLDVKGTFPNGVVALGTYNPDFSNIEDVVETIDFTYVERYLPEYRPFFQEGSWFFPNSRIFYSRRIEDVDWGLKTFGTVGQHRFGFLDTYARGGENHAVLDYQYLLSPQKELVLSAVERNVPGEPDNLALKLGTSMDWPFEGGGHYFRAHHYGTTTDGEGGDGSSASVYLSTQRQQGWSYSASYEAVQPDFRADDGY